MGGFSPRIAAIAAVAIAAIVFATSAILGNGPDAAVAMPEDQLPKTITVLGDGSVSVTPDEGILSMGTRAKASSATEALSGVSAKTAELVDTLKASGIDESDITAAGLSVYPQFNRRLGTKTYNASTEVTVTIRDLDGVGTVIDAAAASAGNSLDINGLELTVADPEKSLGTARKAALANAEKRAKEYAEGIGASLGSVVQVSEIGASSPIAYEESYSAADMATSAGSFAVEPGSQELSARISVVYAVG